MSTTPGTENRCRRLPPGFLFGVATAAYQIEGAKSLGGRTPSIWDVSSQIRGRIADGTSGQITADHLHRWPEDVALLADLGVGARWRLPAFAVMATRATARLGAGLAGRYRVLRPPPRRVAGGRSTRVKPQTVVDGDHVRG